MIYTFRITLPKDKKFLRTIEIKDSQTLFELHKAIMKSCGYDDHQITSFFELNKKKERIREITLFEMSSEDQEFNKPAMDVSLIKNFSFKGLCLLYVFDFFSNRFFNVRLTKKQAVSGRKTYPKITEKKGKAPDQIVLGDFEKINLNTLTPPKTDKTKADIDKNLA